jgi:N-acetylneuraminic acid mutarotase
MKKISAIYCTTILVTSLLQTVIVAQDVWTRKADFPGEGRYSATCFSIGTKCYTGIGIAVEGNSLKDFWEWDQATGIWTRKADFPGNGTYGVVNFSIGTKGYVGTFGDYYSNQNEFWEYDPSKDTWSKKRSLPDSISISGAVGFSIGSKGYIGTGRDINNRSYSNKFWEWDQETDTWTQRADFAGAARQGAVGFSIGNKGYIGTGMKHVQDENIAYVRYKDFWEWDQATNVWTKKADIGGTDRFGAVGFSIGNRGYIGAGFLGQATILNDFWEWDQATNVWKQKADYEGTVGYQGVGFSAGDKGYMGLRNASEFDNSQAYNDFWEFDPSSDVTIAINSISNHSSVEVYPNPVKDKFIIESTDLTEKANLSIFNSNGSKVMERQIPEINTEIDVSMLPMGLYFLRLENGKLIEKGKIVKE